MTLNEQLELILAGQTLEYFRGVSLPARLASEAWALYVEGKVCLVQKRHGENDFGYIMIKRRVLKPVPVENNSSPHQSYRSRKRNTVDVAA